MSDHNRLVQLTPRLRRYARALVTDAMSADELVRDTLQRASAEDGPSGSDADLHAWLFAVMHHVYVAKVKAALAPTRPDGGAEQAWGRSPGSPLLLQDFEHAMGRLSSDQRAVFLLVTLEQMSYDEVARTLGIPIGTVMSRLSRAREKLRAMLLGQARLKDLP